MDLWDRGILGNSSWHQKEEVVQCMNAADMIAHGERTGAWPVAVQLKPLKIDGFECEAPEEQGVVASYVNHRARCVGVVGSRFTPGTVERWRGLMRAAETAGGKPDGAFSLRGGRVIIGTFQINGADDGIVTRLLLADAFDGSQKFTVGTTSIRVVCANTLAMALKQDGAGMAAFRHTSSLDEKLSVLEREIGESLKAGEAVRDLFKRAQDTRITRERAQAAFDALFPLAAEDAAPGIKTRAENARDEARAAMQRPENWVGDNLASFWNAATWLVDRKADGAPRQLRQGAEALDSLIFGTRGDRVAEVHATIESLLKQVA